MKKSLIALAVLAASGAAMAQSSVTLYGLADAYVGSKKTNNQSQAVVDSGGLNGSRWGLKGSEDLGGGLKAVFVLESGFNISTGASEQGGLLFGRQAFVGLNSDSFGSISLGRHYGAYDVAKGSFLSAQGNSPAFDATNGVSGAPLTTGAVSATRLGAWTGYSVRLDNSIRYATPTISGFQGVVVYGFGENKNTVAPTFNNDATKNVSLSLTYANGPLGLAFTHQDEEFTPTFGLKNTAIGGYYDFGIAKAFAAYNHAKYDGLAKQQEWSVGVRAPFGATTLVAQYAHSKGDDLGKNQSVGLSAEYSLSKRTTAYAGLNYTKANLNTAPNVKNHVVGLGVRHTF